MKHIDTYDTTEWAIYALEYSTAEDASLTEQDVTDIERFTAQFAHGYTMDIRWEETNEFNVFPAIGKLACKTIKVDFYTD